MIKTTTLRLPSETLIKIKTLAVETGKSQNNIINELINKGLNATIGNKEGIIKARRIQMPFTDSNKKGNLKDMAGIVEIDDNIDVDDVLDNIHTKKGLY